MARVRITTTYDVGVIEALSEVTTYDVFQRLNMGGNAIKAGRIFVNGKVSFGKKYGGATLDSIGYEMIENAQRMIRESGRVDTGLMLNSVRFRWELKNSSRIDFSLLMGGQGGEATALATGYSKEIHSGSGGGVSPGWRKTNDKIMRNAKRLSYYAAKWEEEYGYIETTMDRYRDKINRAYESAFQAAVVVKAEQKPKGGRRGNIKK